VVACVLAATPAVARTLPGSDGRVEVGGWIDGSAVLDTSSGPHQHPWGRSLLEADADLGRSFSLGFELRAEAGGPYRGETLGFNGFDDAFQNYSPAFDVGEAYVGWQHDRADLRAGIQLFAWGRLDGIPPTDVLNPRDYHDPIVEDPEERKIGVPAVSGTYYAPVDADADLSRLEVQLVYAPIAVPPRLALERERWFPASTVPARTLRVGNAQLPLEFRTENDAPARTVGNGAVGLRIGGTWRSADWDAYYYAGPETGPNARLTADVLPSLAIQSRFRQEHDTIQMIGGDSAFVVGPLSIRAEAAYFFGRPYLRLGSDVTREAVDRFVDTGGGPGPAWVPDLFVDRDAFEWGVGADGVWYGIRPMVQISQIVLTESAPRLLIGDPETRLTVNVRKAIFQERVELEVRGVQAFESGGWFWLPRVAYVPRDDLRLRVGFLAIGGSKNSMIGQFKDNDEVVFDVRWSY
jgi:hypothetical protein